MDLDFPIIVNGKTVMYSSINQFLRHGQKRKAVKYIINQSGCTEDEANDVINDISHMLKLKNEKYEDIKTLQAEYQQNYKIDHDKNISKCPTCQSTDVKKISGTRRLMAGLAFILSPTARSQFECKNCGYKW